MATKYEQLQFQQKIEEIVHCKRCNHIDAIMMYCEETGLEIELVSTLVNNQLKSKIKRDAQDLNLMAKTARLPV